MYAGSSIQALDAKETLFVLLDDSGNSMGTGPREAMEVLRYIADQSKRRELECNISKVPQRDRPRENVRSALVF